MFNLQKAIIPTPVEIQDKDGKIKIASLSNPEFSFDFAGSGDVFDEAKDYLINKFSNKYSIVNPTGSYKISLVISSAFRPLPHSCDFHSPRRQLFLFVLRTTLPFLNPFLLFIKTALHYQYTALQLFCQ